jgi:hypothetical protein
LSDITNKSKIEQTVRRHCLSRLCAEENKETYHFTNHNNLWSEIRMDVHVVSESDEHDRQAADVCDSCIKERVSRQSEPENYTDYKEQIDDRVQLVPEVAYPIRDFISP